MGTLILNRRCAKTLRMTMLLVAITGVQATAQKLNSVDATPSLNYLNSRPTPPNAYRVLFIGDSLTYHEKAPNVWDYASGMAATSPEKDFVHLTAQHIQARLPRRPVEILVNNGGNGRLGPMLGHLSRHPELRPSLVILQGGENDAFDEAFKTTYQALLDFYKKDHVPYIVLGDWWKAEKSDFSDAEAQRRSYSWVDLMKIDADPAMSGYAGPHNVPGVGRHPNDNGMHAIADVIDRQFDASVLPNVKAK